MHSCSTSLVAYSSGFSRLTADVFQVRSFSKKIECKVMDVKVEDTGGPSLPSSTSKMRKSSSRRPPIQEEQRVTTTMTMTTMRYRREKVFAHRFVYETVVAQRARVRGVFAKRGSTIGNKCNEFVDRDLNVAIIIR
jgi:hypothetical protein